MSENDLRKFLRDDAGIRDADDALIILKKLGIYNLNHLMRFDVSADLSILVLRKYEEQRFIEALNKLKENRDLPASRITTTCRSDQDPGSTQHESGQAADPLIGHQYPAQVYVPGPGHQNQRQTTDPAPSLHDQPQGPLTELGHQDQEQAPDPVLSQHDEPRGPLQEPRHQDPGQTPDPAPSHHWPRPECHRYW